MVLVEIHGAPLHLRCDNGGEFIADDLKKWLAHAGIQTRFIEPGSPWQNGVNESFNGKFRDECLNRELLANVLEAQCVARVFRDEYNNIRPHMTIGYRTPAEYRAELLGQAPGSGRTCQAGSSLRLELASVPTSDHNLNPDHQPAQTLTAGGSTLSTELLPHGEGNLSQIPGRQVHTNLGDRRYAVRAWSDSLPIRAKIIFPAPVGRRLMISTPTF
jgi:hypothetical protein